MDQRLVAALPLLVESAKKKEYPESVFAIETIIEVMWYIARDNGDDDPDNSTAVAQKCAELGDYTYQTFLDLEIEVITEQLNFRLANAKDNLQDLWFALCMLVADKLTTEEVIYVVWSFWEYYNPADMVEFPLVRSPLLAEIPYPLLNLLLVHYGPGAFDLDKLFAEVEYQLNETFARYRDMFVVQKITPTPS